MTAEQVNKAVGLFRATLEKCQGQLKKDSAQKALGTKGLATAMVAVFLSYVERFSPGIIRIVMVDRDQTPEQAIAATGRRQYVTAEVVATMPKGAGKAVTVIFFKPDRSAYDVNGIINDDNLAKQYELNGLIPADPFSLAAVNEADPAFADKHPNVTHWKDVNGEWCYAAFFRWRDERGVDVNRRDFDWDIGWLFAGLQVPQVSQVQSS